MRKMGPLPSHHPLIVTDNATCPACRIRFEIGDYITLVTLGPGDNLEERDKARRGVPYAAVAVPVHWACATGKENE